jgi:[NiFe] hydrogenase assembly HybE family chaperone
MPIPIAALEDYYRKVYDERMRGLAVVNPGLEVEAVGFRRLDEHELGALITPWFINLFLLPGSERWDEHAQGSTCTIDLPGGSVDFTIAHDEELGTTLSAALFSTVADFPDQALAREAAAETLRLLRRTEADGEDNKEPGMTRRELFGRLAGKEGARE